MVTHHTWEHVATHDPRAPDHQVDVWRLSVPGGWIYRFGAGGRGEQGVFVSFRPMPSTSATPEMDALAVHCVHCRNFIGLLYQYQVPLEDFEAAIGDPTVLNPDAYVDRPDVTWHPCARLAFAYCSACEHIFPDDDDGTATPSPDPKITRERLEILCTVTALRQQRDALAEALRELVDDCHVTDSFCEHCQSHAPKNDHGVITGPIRHQALCAYDSARAALAALEGGGRRPEPEPTSPRCPPSRRSWSEFFSSPSTPRAKPINEDDTAGGDLDPTSPRNRG